MRSLARVIHLARQRVDPIIVKLQSTSVKEWPPHLSIAFELLQRKSALTDQKVLSIIIESVRAAHACAKAINHRSDRTVSFRTRGKLRNTFKLFANCTKRAPPKLRSRLNDGIFPLIRDNPADSELIETILATTVATFLKFSEEEAAKTALQLMFDIKAIYDVNYDRVAAIKNEYSVLDSAYQRKAEDAITAIQKSPNKKTIASDVFRSLASALDSSEPKKVSAEIHALIVDYVVTVANLWRSVGLRPSRARYSRNPAYISSFHRFVDLVLTAMIEPWSQRHIFSVDSIRQKARTNYDRRRAAELGIPGPPLKDTDIYWLVSDDHVKKALRNVSKKQA